MLFKPEKAHGVVHQNIGVKDKKFGRPHRAQFFGFFRLDLNGRDFSHCFQTRWLEGL